MNNNIRFFILIVGLLVASGCNRSEPTSQEGMVSNTPTSTLLVSHTTPTLDVVQTPILEPGPPTVTVQTEYQIAELLQASNCTLPCYLKITPGKTPIIDALATFVNINVPTDAIDQGYELSFEIGNNS